MEDLRSIIVKHPLFEGIADRHAEVLSAHATRARFDTDQIIFREGEVAWQLYLILRGKVALECYLPPHEHTQIQLVEAGQVLGWSWLFQPYCWHFQARVLEPTEAIFLDGSRLLIACEEDHDLGYELMKRISQVLIHRLEATRTRLIEHLPEEKRMAA